MFVVTDILSGSNPEVLHATTKRSHTCFVRNLLNTISRGYAGPSAKSGEYFEDYNVFRSFTFICKLKLHIIFYILR